MAKKRSLPARVKRMRRPARLQSARSWLPTYSGKNIVKGYRKHFAVDFVCAIKELEMLGVKIDPVHKQQLLTTVRCAAEARQKKKAAQLQREKLENALFEYYDDFEFVAGHLESEAYDPLYPADNVELRFESGDDDMDIPF